MNKSFTMALQDDLYSEIEALIQKYMDCQEKPVSNLNIQEYIRLVIKTHLQEVRGPRQIEKMRIEMFTMVSFLTGKCPVCKLSVDPIDFPALSKIGQDGWKCQICGANDVEEAIE